MQVLQLAFMEAGIKYTLSFFFQELIWCESNKIIENAYDNGRMSLKLADRLVPLTLWN